MVGPVLKLCLHVSVLFHSVFSHRFEIVPHADNISIYMHMRLQETPKKL